MYARKIVAAPKQTKWKTHPGPDSGVFDLICYDLEGPRETQRVAGLLTLAFD
jgi:hypothetical protein